MVRSWSGLNLFERSSHNETPEEMDETSDILDRFGDTISRRPITTFMVIMIITLFFFMASSGALPRQDNSMSDNISTNVDQYIPEGTEEKRVLDIVRENWATKVVIIFIQTGNAFDKSCTVNVTNRDVLEEISSVEGDELYTGSNFARGDSGRDDWIEYIFSLPTLIKEINSSSPRMINVLEEEMAHEIEEQTGLTIDVSDDDDVITDQAKYAIPEEQDTVDQIIAQIPDDVLTSFCADTNGDDIWDSTYTLMGCLEETPDEYEKDFIDRVILNRRTARGTDAESPHFQDSNGPHHTRMAQTGLIAIMIDITDECNDQLMRTMPIAIAFVIFVMLVAHRNPKVFLIAGIPLTCTIFWTFGIITLTNLELSPLVVAAMPMLIGLSVDYSLHISNRITEFEEEGYTIKEGIRKTYHTTGVAVLLSAVTTMIGFAALLIAPLSPIRMLGLLLIIGIASAFFLSLTIVPCIVLIFHYKKPELKIWERVARVPIKHKWHIIGAVAIVTLISLANLTSMTETPEGQQEFDSQGLESLEAIKQMSEIWSRGSTSLLVIEPRQSVYPNGGALNDTEFLDQIEAMQNRITQIEKHVDIEDVSAMTIVDLFKSVALNFSWTSANDRVPDFIKDLIPDYVPNPGEIITYHYTYTYWEFIHLSDDPEFQLRAIRIFYNSLTQEARDMLMTPDYSMTLCMIQYPYSGRAIQEEIIDSVNGIVDDTNNAPGSTTAISQTTGGAAISITIHEAIMDTQVRTLLLSLLFVFIALTVVFTKGSKADNIASAFKEGLRFSLFTMIPVATVVAWQPLIMKSVSTFEGGASLNFMTAMISSVVIGAGIDFGVHITERIREEGETLAGIQRAVQHTGQSIMEANLTTVAGLTGGLFVVWFRGFFSVLLLLLLYSMFAGMILLPSVYAAFASRRERKGIPSREGTDPTTSRDHRNMSSDVNSGSDDIPDAEKSDETLRGSDSIGEFDDEDVEWEIVE